MNIICYKNSLKILHVLYFFNAINYIYEKTKNSTRKK